MFIYREVKLFLNQYNILLHLINTISQRSDSPTMSAMWMWLKLLRFIMLNTMNYKLTTERGGVESYVFLTIEV